MNAQARAKNGSRGEADAPSLDLYNEVRAGFVKQGLSLNAWCRRHGIRHHHAKACLIGVWNGPKAQALRQQLIELAVREEAA